ncbi:hypothetical protein [Nocardiopsis alba]|uniref:hypothetical protein n=1 Tax=Nocardiopsis alba TaxID=53437 RepID=UPI003411D058
MPYPTYTVDGVPLDAPGWRLAPGTALRPLPAVRTAEVQVPGRAGDLPVTGLDLEATTLGMTLWVGPRTPDGSLGGFAGLEENLAALTSLFGARHRMLDLRFHVDADTVRQADAEVVTAAEPEVNVASATALLTVLFRVPGVYWRDPDASSWEAPMGTESPPEGVAVDALSGSTAPIVDARLVLSGPLARPEVTDVATGGGFRWDGTLTANQALEVDCERMTARVLPEGRDVTGSVTAFGPGSASRWLHLTPERVADDPYRRVPRVRLEAADSGDGSRIDIHARRAFL